MASSVVTSSSAFKCGLETNEGKVLPGLSEREQPQLLLANQRRCRIRRLSQHWGTVSRPMGVHGCPGEAHGVWTSTPHSESGNSESGCHGGSGPPGLARAQLTPHE